ncbi:uncharacterized protein LOC125314595 [Rhodamnia argentea]|uniref:Uncharacterized protein LOC125314595 n=1 Tax=Rhodamnia argentea TaxID=178133 RepID=A0ABM3H9E7_9MYRT|nr:uncharacterized protein LOC125314595 [Rhodamnia argentea]
MLHGSDRVVPNWNAFSEAFIGKFFSAAAREQKLVEFRNLRQGNMTIEQYEAEFARLSKYAPRMVDNPLDKARRFRDGLQPDLRSQPVALDPQNYEELYRRGQLIERDMRERRKIAPGPRFVPRRDNRNFGKRPMMNNRRFVHPVKKGIGKPTRPNNRNWLSLVEGDMEMDLAPAEEVPVSRCGKMGHHVEQCTEKAPRRFSTRW